MLLKNHRPLMQPVFEQEIERFDLQWVQLSVEAVTAQRRIYVGLRLVSQS